MRRKIGFEYEGIITNSEKKFIRFNCLPQEVNDFLTREIARKERVVVVSYIHKSYSCITGGTLIIPPT